MNNIETTQALETAYNDIPYTSVAFPHCQPNRLHALAKLKGLNPPELDNARVLEIGCSFGGNLIPFAIRYPNSQIVGIDLSEIQINIGQKMMQEIGLNNVHLVAADISKVNFENLQFDYIICHGVFSWVPEFVQNAIMQLIQTYLTPNGVAFISYNAYPGWHLKDMVKELMQFGTSSDIHHYERIDQAKELFAQTEDLLERFNPQTKPEFSRIAQHILNADKYYVAHEYLEEVNQPFYFHQFIKKITPYGLGYITDTSLPSVKTLSIFSGEKYEQLCQYFHRDIVKIEQYTDFINQRPFRCSILTHQHNLNGYNIDKYDMVHAFYELYIKGNLTKSDDNSHWLLPNGNQAFASSPLSDELAKVLNDNTVPYPIKELFPLLTKNKEDENTLIKLLVALIHQESMYISYHTEESTPFGEYPKLSDKFERLIKFVKDNPNITKLSSIYGQPIEFNVFTLYLIKYLDGNHSLDDLNNIIRKAFENNELTLNREGKPVPYAEIQDKEISDMINGTLQHLQNLGYFNNYNEEE
ncbi:methyltransferase regulatory domain-containing protein [Ursidibacter sp. B-7004-1]